MENRRKTILINRKFQIIMIIKFISLNIVLLALFSGVVYLFLDSEVGANLQKAHLSYRNVRDMLLPIVISLSVITIVISSVIIAFFVLMASFRIAGPLYRFNTVVTDLGKRDFTTATSLRKQDQLYECSISLKETVKKLSGDFSGMKTKTEELISLCGIGSAADKAREIKNILDRYSL